MVCWSIVQIAHAQDNGENAIQDILELWTANNDGEQENTYFLEQLEIWSKHPFDINTDDISQLQSTGLFTDLQIQSLLAYRKVAGDLLTKYELQAVPEFDAQIARTLAPYFTTGKEIDQYNYPLVKSLYTGENQVYLRTQMVLEPQKGYQESTNNGYLGDNRKYVFKYRHTYSNQLSYGFSAEKDPGEEFFTGTEKQGFDHYSFHFYLKNKKWLKHLAIGDYELNFGQGLVMWTGFGAGKSLNIASAKKSGQVVKPFTSITEVGYNRGAAATIAVKKSIFITPFISFKSAGGNVTSVDSTDNTALEISSLDEDGMHRTQSEIDDRNVFQALQSGININYKKRKFNIGATAVYNKLSATLNPAYQPYNKYVFRGNSLLNFSLDYSWSYRNFVVFGETAVNDQKQYATVNGVIASIDPLIDISLVHRYFSPGYFAFQAQAFSENTLPANEHAMYWGVSIKPHMFWRLDAYIDVFQFPYLRYTTDAPSVGRDFMAQLNFMPNKQVLIYARFATKQKQENDPLDETSAFERIVNSNRSNFRINFQTKISKAITLRSRLETSAFTIGDMAPSRGYMVYQDIIVKPMLSALSGNFRFCIFNTDDYASRIYTYENDVLFSYSIPSVYFKGFRYYLNLKYRIAKPIDFFVRFSQTHYFNQTTIGSGLDEINGNTKSEIKAVLRFKF